jgi:hypothetical protein
MSREPTAKGKRGPACIGLTLQALQFGAPPSKVCLSLNSLSGARAPIPLCSAARPMEHTLVNPANGNEYVGHVPVGKLTGTGTFRCAKNGVVYTGEYEGNRFHGIGELTWANGDVYRGQFKGGLREGDGVSTWANGVHNGNVYRGQFKGDLMEGDGEFTWANGNVYRGQWKGDKREGEGVFTLADGSVYRGQWKGDKMEGEGVYTFANGHVYSGQFKGDVGEGDGVFTWASGAIYRGQFKGYEKEGDGVYTSADGKVYRGQFKGGYPENCVVTYVSEGFFSAGKKKTKVGRYEGDMEVSSVPFDAADPVHAALLGAATAAEARRRAASARARSARVSNVRCRHGRAPPGRKLRRCAMCTLRAVGSAASVRTCLRSHDDWHRQASADEASRGAKAAKAKAEVPGMQSGVHDRS